VFSPHCSSNAQKYDEGGKEGIKKGKKKEGRKEEQNKLFSESLSLIPYVQYYFLIRTL